MYNPVAGTGAATTMLDKYVRPKLLSWLGQHVANPEVSCHETNSAESAHDIGALLGSRVASLLTIVVIGGDGTAHELIDGIVTAERNDASRPKHDVHLVIVPTGTANALFFSLFGPGTGAQGLTDKDRLVALESLTDNDHHENLRHLSLLGVQHSNEPDAQTHHGLVISSHSLHAAIVRDSENLRKDIPDVSRFKRAATENAKCWSNASLRLRGDVMRYEPKNQSFVKVTNLPGYDVTEDGTLTLEGPFAYMNAMVIDRLEQDFVPATFAANCQSDVARPANAMDIVVIRPLRSKYIRSEFEAKKPAGDIQTEFANDVLVPTLMGGMYNEGVHVGQVYTGADGKPETENGQDTPIVEYFRASSYEWTAHDDQARTSCVDGTIFNSAVTRAQISDAVQVYAWADRSKYRA